MKNLLFPAIAVVIISGCATYVDYTSKSMGITMDMTKDQVISLMGSPKKASARKSPEGLVERYSWWSPKMIGFTPIDNEMLATDRVFVRFINGKVVEWGDKYDFSESMDKATEKQSEILKNYQQKIISPTTNQ